MPNTPRERLNDLYQELKALPAEERKDRVSGASEGELKEIFSSDAPLELAQMYRKRYHVLLDFTHEQAFAGAMAGSDDAMHDVLTIINNELGKDAMLEVCHYRTQFLCEESLRRLLMHYSDNNDTRTYRSILKRYADAGDKQAYLMLAEDYEEEGHPDAEKYFMLADKNGS